MSTLFVRLAYFTSFIIMTWAVALLSAPGRASANPMIYTTPIDTIMASPAEDIWEIDFDFETIDVEPEPAPELPVAAPEPTHDIVVVRALVTACSPQDAIDQAYYARHGYEGSTYNIAADLSVLPRGTQIRVPGYMDVSFPDKFWNVDSAGGSIIRRSTRRGVLQFDVKYRTEYSAKKWGSQWLDVEILVPRTHAGSRLLERIRPHIVKVY